MEKKLCGKGCDRRARGARLAKDTAPYAKYLGRNVRFSIFLVGNPPSPPPPQKVMSQIKL